MKSKKSPRPLVLIQVSALRALLVKPDPALLQQRAVTGFSSLQGKVMFDSSILRHSLGLFQCSAQQ